MMRMKYAEAWLLLRMFLIASIKGILAGSL